MMLRLKNENHFKVFSPLNKNSLSSMSLFFLCAKYFLIYPHLSIYLGQPLKLIDINIALININNQYFFFLFLLLCRKTYNLERL